MKVLLGWALVGLACCNIWDNILSRLETKHRIVLPEADQFEVAYKRLLSSYVVSVDFDRTSKLHLQLDMEIGGLFRQPIFTARLNTTLRTLTAVVHSRKKCIEIKLPPTVQISYGNSSYPLAVDGFKVFNVLVSALTIFDHAEGNTFIYKIGQDLLSNRTEKRKLQSKLEDFANLQELKSLLKVPNLGETDSANTDQQAEPAENEEEDPMEDSPFGVGLGGLTGIMLEQNPIGWLRSTRPKHASLKFIGSRLQQFDVGKQKFKLLRKTVSIYHPKDEECKHEDWSDKTSKQIFDRLQLLVYQ